MKDNGSRDTGVDALWLVQADRGVVVVMMVVMMVVLLQVVACVCVGMCMCVSE